MRHTRRDTISLRAHARRFPAAAACLLVAMAAASMPSSAATSSVTVNLSVLSATSIVATGCATGTSGVTEFGTVPAGTNAVTSADCVIDFGSTNDTSQLRLQQSDGADRGMYRPATGSLDTTFSGDGRNSQAGHQAYELDAYGDGDWISVGEGLSGSWRFDIVRWNGDGTIQWRSTPLQTGCIDCMAFAVDTMADGDIVVGGHYDDGAIDLALMRLEPGGGLDTTFDGDGYVKLARAGEQRIHGLVEQPGKGIVAVGVSFEGASDAAIAVRYDHDGVLDTTFGTGGIRVLQHTAGHDRAFEVALQDDGSILVGGLASGDAFVTRLTADGAVDTDFGASGTRFVDFNGSDGLWNEERVGMAVDPRNGDILIGAEAGPGLAATSGLARMDLDGAMVAGFGTNGVLLDDVVPGNWEDTDGMLVEDDGRIVVPYMRGGDIDSGYLVRRHADGTRDATFGTNGVLEVAPAITDDQYGLSVRSDSDGRLVTISYSTITRLGTTTIPDLVSGSQDWDQGTGMFGACLRSLTGGTPDGTTWTVDGDASCTAADTDPWNPIAASGSKVARRTTPGTATARLRFGVRAPAATPKGGFVAPMRFTVLAPDV